MTIKALAFDLDDTLLDTSGLLVETAYEEACSAMIQAGLNTDIQTCTRFRKEAFKKDSKDNIFSFIATKFGAKDKQKIANIGYAAFYHRDVREDLDLMPGVRDMLTLLQANYTLYLVSSGAKSTQNQKVEILKMAHWFENIYFVDPALDETKKMAFSQILETYHYKPTELLCVGNRMDDEISAAKSLGMPACLVNYGEYVGLKAKDKAGAPDFTIEKITDLLSVCQL